MWFQSPEYLHWSRLRLLKEKNRERIISEIGILPGDHVLDVGCGTGEFTQYLKKGIEANFTGIDIDEDLILTAKDNNSDITYVTGDALKLPFEDDFFDVVVSHTFFNSVFNAEGALEEMKRVCKPEGIIASITSDSFYTLPFDRGNYHAYSWLQDYEYYKEKLERAFGFSSLKFTYGVKPERMMLFFSENGLSDVKVIPIEKFDSISNLTGKEREQFVIAEYEADLSRIELLPEEDRGPYKCILDFRKEVLLSDQTDTIWDWTGGLNLLLVASNHKKDNVLYNKNVNDSGLKFEMTGYQKTYTRTNVGAIASARYQNKKIGIDVSCIAINPSMAIEKAKCKVLFLQRISEEILSERSLENALVKESVDLILDNKSINGTDYLEWMYSWGEELKGNYYNCVEEPGEYFLPELIVKWFYGENICYEGESQEEAIMQGMLEACAIYATNQFAEGKIGLHVLAMENCLISDTIERMVTSIWMNKYQITFFDASCGIKLPTIGILLARNGNIRVVIAAGKNLEEAITNCLLKCFLNRNIEHLIQVKSKMVKTPLSDFEKYNLQLVGEGHFPERFYEKDREFSGFYDYLTLSDLRNLFTSLGWKSYFLVRKVEDKVICRLLVPKANMKFNLGKERYIEFRLRRLATNVLGHIESASPEEVKSVIRYLEFTRPYMDKADGEAVLGRLLIANEEFEKASLCFHTQSTIDKCLSDLLQGMSLEVAEQIYGKALAKDAWQIKVHPLRNLNYEIW